MTDTHILVRMAAQKLATPYADPEDHPTAECA